MNSTVLAAAIKTKVISKNPQFAANIGNHFDWLFESVAEAVVEHIQTTAVVLVPSVSGVTPGVGVSGSGAGTIV